MNTKHDILRQLQREILPLQGFKQPAPGQAVDIGLGPILSAFPNACFPTGAIHEFISEGTEHTAACSAVIAGLLGGLMEGGKVAVWISAGRMLFPPALKMFGIEPEKVIFIHGLREKDMLWVLEEVLKCDGLAAVVAELREIGFVESRRLQLAVEHSRVTGFLLRQQPRQMNTSACISRWHITAAPSVQEGGRPGFGFPRWAITLSKVRNGKPGTWHAEWRSGVFYIAGAPVSKMPVHRIGRKTG